MISQHDLDQREAQPAATSIALTRAKVAITTALGIIFCYQAILFREMGEHLTRPSAESQIKGSR